LIASIEREIEILRNSAASGSIESKLKLEEETATLKEKIREITVKNKDLQRQVDGSSRKIEALNNNEEPRDTKKILEELRTSKEKLKEIELKYQGELQRSAMIKTKIQELENEARESGIDTNNLYSSKSSKKVETVEVDQHKKRDLEATLASLEKEKNQIIGTAKKRVAEVEEGKGSIKEEIARLSKVLKEKEHDIKLREHEINDLKRNQKNLQTKMNPMPDIMIEATKEAPKAKPKGKVLAKNEVKEEDKPKEIRARQLSIHDETEKKRSHSGSSSGSKSSRSNGSDKGKKKKDNKKKKGSSSESGSDKS
jgi:chromosome segregation ATPase